MKSAAGQDHHVIGELSNQRAKLSVGDVGLIAVPATEPSHVIQDHRDFRPDNPAVIGQTLCAEWVVAATFPPRVQQFNAKSVGHAQQARLGQGSLGPLLMGLEQTKQPTALGQLGKQGPIVAAEPTVEGMFADAFQGEQQTQRDNLAWLEFGLAMFWHVTHHIVHLAKQDSAKLDGSHRVCSFFGLPTLRMERTL